VNVLANVSGRDSGARYSLFGTSYRYQLLATIYQLLITYFTGLRQHDYELFLASPHGQIHSAGHMVTQEEAPLAPCEGSKGGGVALPSCIYTCIYRGGGVAPPTRTLYVHR